MFGSTKSKYTFVSIAAGLMLFSLFQNCGSSAGKKYSGDDGDPTVLDTGSPQISITEKPSLLTNETVATFQLSVYDERSGFDYAEYQHNGGEWKKIVNMVMLTGLASGDHEIKFKAYDKNKNESKILFYKWIVDTDKPLVTITEEPDVLSSEGSFGVSKKMLFKFTSSDKSGIASSVCKIDGDVVDCTSKKEFFALATVGNHSASIVITDNAGNITSVTKHWSVSSGVTATVVPPHIFKSPDQHNNLSTVEIRFSGIPISGLPAGSSYKCYLDGVAVTPCRPNVINKYDGLKERMSGGKVIAHMYRVDLKHGTLPLVKSIPVSWFTDMHPPTVEWTDTKPGAFSLTRNPDFIIQAKDNVAESSLKLLCQLDGAEYADCVPNINFKIPVAPGDHVLKVVAEDEAGNTSTVMLSHSWKTASCTMDSLGLRFPMTGPENRNWSVHSFVDANDVEGPIKDWGPREGSRARTTDQQQLTYIYAGDNVRVFGADFKSKPENAKVVAMAAGKVLQIVQDKIDTSKKGVSPGCSTSDFNRVRIQHDNGYISHYRHLAQNSVPSDVKVGQRVSKGQVIGYVGSSGCLQIPYLSVAVEKCQSGTYADPFAMSMQIDEEQMHYDGNPIIHNLVLHNKVLGYGAADIKTIMNRTNEYKSTEKVTAGTGIAVTFFASKLTAGQQLRVSFSKKENNDFKTFDYQDVGIVGSSHGRFRIINFKGTTKGEWVLRVFHTNNDNCRSSNKDLWNDCVVQSKTFEVK
jgi:hypothetical protein